MKNPILTLIATGTFIVLASLGSASTVAQSNHSIPTTRPTDVVVFSAPLGAPRTVSHAPTHIARETTPTAKDRHKAVVRVNRGFARKQITHKPNVHHHHAVRPKTVHIANPDKWAAAQVWAQLPEARKIQRKESGFNCKAVNPSGKYRGKWQMDKDFWASYGGLAYASRPDLASCAAQNYVAYRGYLARGWSPWSTA